MTLKEAKRVLVLSDVHYEKSEHKGVDEGGAAKWLLSLVERHKPDLAVVLGDWGTGWSADDFAAIAARTKVIGIYGNHDPIEFLETCRNVDGSRVLQEDGLIRNIGGLRFGFINGVVSEPPKKRYEKSRDEFLKIGARLEGQVDILCTHESPIPSELKGIAREFAGQEMMDTLIRKIKPAAAFNGHVSPIALTGAQVGDTLAVTLESNQKLKHYAVMDCEGMKIGFWKDSLWLGNADISLLVEARRGSEEKQRYKHLDGDMKKIC